MDARGDIRVPSTYTAAATNTPPICCSMFKTPSLAPPSIADQIIAWIVKIVALFLPRLDQFAQSTWVMSDVVPQSLSSSFLQSVPCLGIIIAASLFDLYRKTQTEVNSPLRVQIYPGQRFDAIAVLGVEADSVTILVTKATGSPT